jgi:hypothetical protein
MSACGNDCLGRIHDLKTILRMQVKNGAVEFSEFAQTR